MARCTPSNRTGDGPFIGRIEQAVRRSSAADGCPQGEECHGSPSCSHGRLYLQTTGALYCLQRSPKDRPVRPRLRLRRRNPPLSDDRQPAYVQVVPAEVLIKPGETAAVYGAVCSMRAASCWRPSRTPSSHWTAPGKYRRKGDFTAAVDRAAYGHHRAGPSRRVGRSARVRVVPQLALEFLLRRRQGADPLGGSSLSAHHPGR